jgi:hypothetical protein
MQASRPADEDRLPWLEPYRETMAQEQRWARRAHGGLVAYAGALVLLIAAASAGYWFGQRGEAPTVTSPSATVALPEPKSQPVKVAETASAEPLPIVGQAQPEPAKVARHASVKKKSAMRKRARARKIRSAGVETAQLNAVRAAQERQAQPPKPVSQPWPKMPSPGPAGQVIQLGAFTTPIRANAAYSARVARYPLLGRMPRVIVPVATKPSGRVHYVLRLGTTSRQQSKTVCRNLRRSGDHCLVIG